MQVFVDVDIGDPENHKLQLANFDVSEAFFRKIGPQVTVMRPVLSSHGMPYCTACRADQASDVLQFNLAGALEEQDAESISLIEEAFKTDPSWAAKVNKLFYCGAQTSCYFQLLKHIQRNEYV